MSRGAPHLALDHLTDDDRRDLARKLCALELEVPPELADVSPTALEDDEAAAIRFRLSKAETYALLRLAARRSSSRSSVKPADRTR